jgi:hypothetical protein
VRNYWNTVLKAKEEQTQARNSERSDGVRGIVDTATPTMTAQTLVNELIIVLYLCHSDIKLYRPRSVVEMGTITIDNIKTNHISTESILEMLLHLGYLSKHGTYQRICVVE